MPKIVEKVMVKNQERAYWDAVQKLRRQFKESEYSLYNLRAREINEDEAVRANAQRQL